MVARRRLAPYSTSAGSRNKWPHTAQSIAQQKRAVVRSAPLDLLPTHSQATIACAYPDSDKRNS
jgi:hypothetical protein